MKAGSVVLPVEIGSVVYAVIHQDSDSCLAIGKQLTYFMQPEVKPEAPLEGGVCGFFHQPVQ